MGPYAPAAPMPPALRSNKIAEVQIQSKTKINEYNHSPADYPKKRQKGQEKRK